MNYLRRSSWPIIIGGSHRSGTSLFRRLLNKHPEIFCPTEIKFHQDLLGQVPNDQLSFSRLGATISALGLEQDYWLGEFGKAFVRCYQKAARDHGKKRWADKNPENAINIEHWNRLLNGGMYFALVVRHPYDVVASMEEAQMNRVVPVSSEGRARHIIKMVSAGLEFCGRYPNRAQIIRYEALVTEPERSLREFLKKVNAPFHACMLDALKDTHPKGLEDPKVAKTVAIDTASVGRWRRNLSAATISEIREPLGPLIAELGYET